MVQVNRLSSAKVRNAAPRKGKRSVVLADGGCLFLQATRSRDGERVNKSWLFKFERQGKRHEMGIGPLATIGLAEARERATALRRQLLDGINPMQAREAARAQAERDRQAEAAERAKQKTFKQVAEEYMRAHAKGWSSAKHAAQWSSTLAAYAYPTLGNLSVSDIETAHLVDLLRPLIERVPETAKRVRGRIECVLGYATAAGYRKGDNPARWPNHLKTLLGNNVTKQEHYEALGIDDAPGFMVQLRKVDGLAARALEFLILTAARSGEVLGARWDEFDLKARTWTVPAERMKNGHAHRVPLTEPAVAIIEALDALPKNGPLVFPRVTGEALPDKAMRKVAAKLVAGLTVHGFRATFKTWCDERTSYPSSAAEAALAHISGDKVEQAYKRGDLFKKRTQLMQAWAAYLAKPLPTSDNVHYIGAA